MENSINFKFRDPLSIKIVGTGEYVKREVQYLEDLFDYAEHDHLEALRQDTENE